jgi:amino acid transporter
MRLGLVKRWLVGPPMPLAQARHERLSKPVGLAVFASDPLSSVAYATEEILLVLILGGTVALGYAMPISVAIAALIAVVIISYRQTIRAYPKGGGAYIVSKEYLGAVPGLVAGGSLLIDYILTVAVSVAAGVAAITSAVPALYPYRVVLGIAAIGIIALGNLRGIRESGKLFAAPTYLFVASMLGLIAYGVASVVSSAVPPLQYDRYPDPLESVSILLLMRAFASGCTALTGIEAVSERRTTHARCFYGSASSRSRCSSASRFSPIVWASSRRKAKPWCPSWRATCMAPVCCISKCSWRRR